MRKHTRPRLLYWRQTIANAPARGVPAGGVSDPDSERRHITNLGLALAQLGHLEEAARELNEASILDPKYTDARIQLGLVLGQNNDHWCSQCLP